MVMQLNGEPMSGSRGLILSTSSVKTEAGEGLDLTWAPLSWECS